MCVCVCVSAQIIEQLWALGYSPEDIIGNIFRVCKTFQMAEYLKLEFIKVRSSRFPSGGTTTPAEGGKRPLHAANMMTCCDVVPLPGDRLHPHEGGGGGQLPPADGWAVGTPV